MSLFPNASSLNRAILIAAILAICCGIGLSPYIHTGWGESILYGLSWISNLFIGLLKMLLVPLIFSSIVVGVANLQAVGNFGRAWKITLLAFVTTTTCALILGLSAAHLFDLGRGLDIKVFEQSMQLHAQTSSSPAHLSPSEFLDHFIKNTFINPFKAMSDGNILAIVVFALLLGAVIVSGRGKFEPMQTLMQQLFDMMMILVQWIMRLAPYGIFALLVQLVASSDWSVLEAVAKFAIVVTATTLIHGIIVLPLLLWIFGRIRPGRYFQVARPALIMAFATSSSSATLPLSMQCAQQLGVRPQVAGFVVPLGAQLNMDGTALYEAAAALFIAHLMGMELSLMQQAIVCLTAMLASVGAPGIPSAGMVTMIMVLQSVGLPAEAIAILLPMDRLLDTVRTVVNVQGDMMIAAVVERYTGSHEIN